MNKLLQKVLAGVQRVFAEAEEPEEERATSWSAIYEQVMTALWDNPEFNEAWPWLNDLYQEEDRTVAIVSAGGKLFRVPVMINGTDVELGTAEEVEMQFVPAQRQRFSIIRQADGTHRWFAITETAVLLRVGELDSRALFDSFIQHAEETGEYPTLRFFHDDRIEFGQADWLAREDNCYLASGTFDEEHPVARAFIDASEQGRGVWGTSNGFTPTAEPEMLEVAEGVTIPVYTAGVHREISILPEESAASWFTTITAKGVTRMRDSVKQALETLFGDDDAAAAFIAKVDDTNREITERGLITRDANDSKTENDNPGDGEEAAREADAADDKSDVAPEADKKDAPAELEIGEELVIQITAKLRETFAETLDEIGAKLTAMEARLNAIPATPDLGPVFTRCKRIEDRLVSLERTEEEKQREWEEDRPARRAVKVTYRPRQAPPSEATSAVPASNGKPDLAAVAASTLANLPPR